MNLKFTCYFPAETLIFFAINIELDAWVEELVMAIVAELKEKGVINVASTLDRSFIRLFKFKVNTYFLWRPAN